MAQRLEIQFDPSFMEEAVFLELSAREAAGHHREARAFHVERSAVYEAEGSPAQHEAAFQHLAARCFCELGFAELFAKRIAEVPLVAAHVQAMMVRRVSCRKEERVELYVPPASDASQDPGGPTTLLIDTQALRCRNRQRLVAWLQHELMHVSDMLDPAFAYEPHPVLGGECELEDDLIRGRFRLLWNLLVGARMRRKGWQAVMEEPARRLDFERMFAPWAAARREAVWRDLETRERWTQHELLELAHDARLTRTLGQGGTRCPLCHFPTPEGVRDWSGNRADAVEVIRRDYPAWKPSHGACLQCVELYRSRLPAYAATRSGSLACSVVSETADRLRA